MIYCQSPDSLGEDGDVHRGQDRVGVSAPSDWRPDENARYTGQADARHVNDLLAGSGVFTVSRFD